MTSPVGVSLNAFRCDAYQTIAFGSLSSSYTAFTNPIIHNWRFIHFNNTTDADAAFSFDGTTNNVYVPASSGTVYDLASNGLAITKQTVVYAKTLGSPSKGVVTMTGGFERGN